MARSPLNTPSVSIDGDNGAVLFSIVKGEQLRKHVTLSWIANLTSYNIHIRLVEALNDGEGSLPTEVQPNGQAKLLTVSSGHIRSVSGNAFDFVLPWDVATGFAVQPKPSAPVYAYIELEVGEPGTGDDTAPMGDPAALGLQVWKPIRGLLQINYSPTEG